MMLVKKKIIPITFSILIGSFLLIIGMFFVPPVMDIFRGPIFLLPFVVFSLAGIVLVYLTIKQKVQGKIKKFLLLTGTSATGIFVGIILHNLLYALAILTENIVALSYLFEALSAISFIIAIPICPIGFLIGAIGSVVLIVKRRKKLKK